MNPVNVSTGYKLKKKFDFEIRFVMLNTAVKHSDTLNKSRQDYIK